MDSSILLLGIVLAVTLVLIVSNRIRIDLVAILASLALAWLGLITPLEATRDSLRMPSLQWHP